MSAGQAANFMQRVFDELARRPNSTIAEISAALRFDHATIERALRRLRRYRVIHTAYDERTWRYSIKSGAMRPDDGRGGRRRLPRAFVVDCGLAAKAR